MCPEGALFLVLTLSCPQIHKMTGLLCLCWLSLHLAVPSPCFPLPCPVSPDELLTSLGPSWEVTLKPSPGSSSTPSPGRWGPGSVLPTSAQPLTPHSAVCSSWTPGWTLTLVDFTIIHQPCKNEQIPGSYLSKKEGHERVGLSPTMMALCQDGRN